MEVKNRYSLTQEQMDLIERYISAYNTIDHHLRESLKAEKETTFGNLVRLYAARYPRWRDQDLLRMIGDLRNAIVHQREQAYEYLSVPVPSIVENIERIRDEIKSPERVHPKFQRAVITFQAENVLSEVLRCVSEKEFSQFPIYDQGQFMGLLTENGITRWLARHSSTVMTLIELDEVLVKEVLSLEEERKNFGFISRNTSVFDAENHFVRNTMLEALLITANGKPSEKLLGIISRWDVLSL